MKPKDGSLKRSIKLVNLWPDYPRKKKKEITNNCNERGDITVKPRHIKTIIRGYYKEPYAFKLK